MSNGDKKIYSKIYYALQNVLEIIAFLQEYHIKMHLISCYIHIETKLNLQTVGYAILYCQ